MNLLSFILFPVNNFYYAIIKNIHESRNLYTANFELKCNLENIKTININELRDLYDVSFKQNAPLSLTKLQFINKKTFELDSKNMYNTHTHTLAPYI